MSIKEIARRARVSIGTVDRVLHNRGRVSANTARRVRKVAADLQYKPDIYARNLSLAKTFQFGILLPHPSQDNGYWRLLENGVSRAETMLNAYRVRMIHFPYDRFSNGSYTKALKTALNGKLDGLLLAPLPASVARDTIGLIPQSLPFVFLDSRLSDTPYLSSVAQDPFRSGMLAARLMSLLIRGEGRVAIIRVLPEDAHINERIRGFQSYLKNMPTIQASVFPADSSGGDTAFAETLGSILGQGEPPAGIFVSNAWTHAVARHIAMRGLAPTVKIVGYDLIPKNVECLRAGWIDFLISQRPQTQGYEGVHLLYRHVVLKEAVPRDVRVPIDIVTQENIMDYQD